jgi:hypothetical protein
MQAIKDGFSIPRNMSASESGRAFACFSLTWPKLKDFIIIIVTTIIDSHFSRYALQNAICLFSKPREMNAHLPAANRSGSSASS